MYWVILMNIPKILEDSSSLGHLPWCLGSKESCLPMQEMQEMWVEKIPVKEMATHSSILAWRIPWTEEPGGLQSDMNEWLKRNNHSS